METFNLIDAPWIPVRYRSGDARMVSLDTLFREASAIADLDAAPHERISLIRLLVCITQAELGAPETPEDWGDFGQDLATRIPAYLHRPDIYPHFELFGDGPRFLQQQVAASATDYPVDQIDYHLASGNTSTLLDHEGGNARRFTPAKLARAILAYQNFFIGGSMASKVKGNGPSLKFLHCLLQGSNLHETILLNCLDQITINEHFSSMGLPSWAAEPDASGVEDGYLPRLCPKVCALWVMDEGFRIQIEQGRTYLEHPAARDSFATVYSDGDKRILLRANLAKGIWKDLHVITMLRKAGQQEQQAPLNLQSHAQSFGNDKVDLWLGEFVKAKDAKVIDSIESVFTVPMRLFSDQGRILYEKGVQHAETQANQIYGAVKQYGAALKNESPPTDLAKQHYWNTLDACQGILLDLVREIDTHPLTENFGEGDDPWSRAVWDAARAAYEKVCPRQTPRQIQAYAAGLKVLRAKNKSASQNKPKITKEPAAQTAL